MKQIDLIDWDRIRVFRYGENRRFESTEGFAPQIHSYEVEVGSSSIALIVGSNVPHEPFVLGGKAPSWTPLEPLKAWVERKNLSWVDKKSGKALTIEQMAYMIRAKIKREGIPARNVFAEVIKNRESWIFQQLDSIEVVL